MLGRWFCSAPKLKWVAGSGAIAEVLFKKLCTNLDYGVPAVDPRGMRVTQLKRHLVHVGFDDDLARVPEYHSDIIQAWQRLYDDMLNCNIRLPGAEKAGPLTFAKVNDKDCVEDLHDKDGRRLT